MRRRLNERFKNFCTEAESFAKKENNSSILFDVPYTDLKFVGCHAKASVNMYPTAHCLVALSEIPTFVMDIDDIEIVHFERVTMSIKNFDMVFVYKDFTTFKRINSIPMESLDIIKSWLDQVSIVFSEGPMPLNWAAVLLQIREDVGGFISEGGWSFLHESMGATDENAGEESNSDSNFDDKEEKDNESEEAAASDESFSGADSGKTSSVASSLQDELSDEGTTFEEMEREERNR